MNAPEKLPVDRSTFLGGSDAAAVLGVSPWATPLDVFLEKTGQRPEREPDPAREKLFRRGKRLEPVVVDMLIEEYGVKVTKRSTPKNPNRYTDPEHPFLAVEIDYEWEVTPQIVDLVSEKHPEISAVLRRLVGTTQNGEVKTVHPFAAAKFGEAETDEVPIEYTAQAMDGLMVTGREVTMFAVMVGADNLNVYWIVRDEGTIKEMRAQLVDFWTNNVQTGVPPKAKNLPDILQWFSMVPNISVPADEHALDLVGEMTMAKQTASAAMKRVEEIKFELGQYMLGVSAIQWERVNGEMKMMPTPNTSERKHLLTTNGVPVLTVGLQTQSRISSEAVRERHPEIIADVTKTLRFFRFDQPRGKKK
jgi:predicted phage-related endonuclease